MTTTAQRPGGERVTDEAMLTSATPLAMAVFQSLIARMSSSLLDFARVRTRPMKNWYKGNTASARRRSARGPQ